MRLGTSTKHLRYAPTSPEMAVKLAVVTGYSVEFWLTHQARYDARRTYLGPCFLGLASPGYKGLGSSHITGGILRSWYARFLPTGELLAPMHSVICVQVLIRLLFSVLAVVQLHRVQNGPG